MKTILRIIFILFVAAIVAGSLTLIVNNTSSAASGPGGASGHASFATGATGQTRQAPGHAEGGPRGEGSTSFASGFLEILVMLGKLAGITVVVLLIQKVVNLSGRRAPRSITA
jgi:hypothetical protein